MGTVQVCASVLGIPVSESLLEKWRRWYSPALQPFPIDDVIAVERAQLPHRVMQPSDEVRDTFFLYQGEWAWLQENEFRALPAELRERLLASRRRDRKSTRLNSSHVAISYAVFCLKKK